MKKATASFIVIICFLAGLSAAAAVINTVAIGRVSPVSISMKAASGAVDVYYDNGRNKPKKMLFTPGNDGMMKSEILRGKKITEIIFVSKDPKIAVGNLRVSIGNRNYPIDQDILRPVLSVNEDSFIPSGSFISRIGGRQLGLPENGANALINGRSYSMIMDNVIHSVSGSLSGKKNHAIVFLVFLSALILSQAVFKKSRTFADIYKGRNNNFDFIRFLAASMVIFGHSYVLIGLTFHEPVMRVTSNQTYFGGLAVWIFFIISGFLITDSFCRSSSLSGYIKARVLRIIPALFFVMLVGVFILGPLVTTLHLKSYFLHKGTWMYLTGVFMLPLQYKLPGVFVSNPFPIIVNGSLWTIPYEFIFYIFIALLGTMSLFKHRRKTFSLFVFAVFLFRDLFEGIKKTIIPGMTFSGFAMFFGLFLQV